MHNKSLLGSDFCVKCSAPVSAGQWIAFKLDKTLYKKDSIKSTKGVLFGECKYFGLVTMVCVGLKLAPPIY